MRKYENLYTGLNQKRVVGSIDVEWAQEQKKRYIEIRDNDRSVLMIDLNLVGLTRRDNDNISSCQEGK